MNLINNINTKLTKDDYKRFVRQVIRITRPLGLTSLYQIGKVDHPGISDLDIIIVYKNQSSLRQLIKLSTSKLKTLANSSYFLVHPPIIICEHMFPYIKMFHTAENLRHVYGKKLTPNRRYYYKKQYLYWNVYFYHILFSPKHLSDSRQFHLFLRNLLYTIKNNDKDVSTHFYSRLSREISRLRKKALANNIDEDEFKNTLDSLRSTICYQENRRSKFYPFYKINIIFKNRIYVFGPLYWYLNLLGYNIVFLPYEYYDLSYSPRYLENSVLKNKFREVYDKMGYAKNLVCAAFQSVAPFDNTVDEY